MVRVERTVLLPNIVIGGAPKCGTSSLFSWLDDHPEICGAVPKDTHFLNDIDNVDYPSQQRKRRFAETGLEGYDEFFRHCRAGTRLEASAGYLYQRTALDQLATMETHPLVVFILRKPSDRIFSLYNFTRYNMETLPRSVSFAEYVERLQNEADLSADQRTLAPAIRRSDYARYLAGWLERIGQERVRVRLFEHMRADQRGFMASLASEIGIDPAFYREYRFAAKNVTRRVPLRGFERAKWSVGERMPLRLRRGLRPAYRALSSRWRQPVPTDEDAEVLESLDEYFAPINRHLAGLTGLDLRAWS